MDCSKKFQEEREIECLVGKESREWIEIEELPRLKFQRSYIDEYVDKKRTHVGDRKILGYHYGYCENYPRGFRVRLERKIDGLARYREISRKMSFL